MRIIKINENNTGCKYLQPNSIIIYDLFYNPSYKDTIFITPAKNMITLNNLISYNMNKLTDLQKEFIISLIKNCINRETIIGLLEHCIRHPYCIMTCPYRMMFNIYHSIPKYVENNGTDKLLLNGKFPTIDTKSNIIRKYIMKCKE